MKRFRIITADMNTILIQIMASSLRERAYDKQIVVPYRTDRQITLTDLFRL